MKKDYLLRSGLFILTIFTSIIGFAQTTFNYTGSAQTYTVPAGVGLISIECYGASGWSGNYAGGEGGYTYGELVVTPGQNLYVYVGGQGVVSNTSYTPEGGGWNGGGDGQTNTATNAVGGGGGASDVRTIMNANPMDITSLNSRLIIAGGGGGSTNNSGCIGGNGGGLVGQNGWQYSTYPQATGGTQTAGGNAGGALGQGANADGTMTPWNGGGGGGYYGGGISTAHSSGAGGSSYDGGVTNSSMIQGGNVGNGYVVITELCAPINVTVSATTVCDGEQVTLTGTGNGTITWDNGVQNGVAFNPPVGTTTYTATSSDINECGYSVDITVNPSPNVTMTSLAMVCHYDDAFELTVGSPTNGVYSGNGVVADVVFDPGAAGVGTHTITYTVTDPANGCEGTATEDIVVDACLGLNDLEIFGKVYPNPTDGVLNIEFDNEFEYTLINANGQVVMNGNASDAVTIDIDNVEVGMYTLKIEGGDRTFFEKVVKH
jgi:hypothetical protein